MAWLGLINVTPLHLCQNESAINPLLFLFLHQMRMSFLCKYVADVCESVFCLDVEARANTLICKLAVEAL